MKIIYSKGYPTEPHFTRPEILQHPTIPSSLFGVNPRTIKGREWWDVIRKAAYAENNYCCWACGRHTSQLDSPLEAHEEYGYNYRLKTITYEEAVALCKQCHQFIHKGRLFHLKEASRISYREMEIPIRHGILTLRHAGLPMPWGLLWYARHPDSRIRKLVEDFPSRLQYEPIPEHQHTLNQKGWRLIIDGEEHTK